MPDDPILPGATPTPAAVPANGEGVRRFSMLTFSLCAVLALMVGAETTLGLCLLTSSSEVKDWTMLKEIITGLNLGISSISGGLLGAMRGGGH